MDHEQTENSGNNILIIKGRFKSTSMNLYGQLIVIFNGEKHVESYNTVVSTFSDAYNLEPNSEWNKCEETIVNLKWKGDYNASLTTSMMEEMNKYFVDIKNTDILYENTFNYDYKNMDAILYDLVNRIIHDKNLILETGIEEVTQEDFRKGKEGEQEKNEKDEDKDQASDDNYSLEEGSAILLAKPILSPVKGKPIYDLKLGDRIMIKIEPNTDRSNYFIDLLDLREENSIKSAPAEVVDIKVGTGKNDPIDILTLLGPGIYGKFTEEEKQVKLKIYNPAVDGPIASQKSDTTANITSEKGSVEKPLLSKGTLVMLLLFFAILTLFIILIMISW